MIGGKLFLPLILLTAVFAFVGEASVMLEAVEALPRLYPSIELGGSLPGIDPSSLLFLYRRGRPHSLPLLSL